LRRNEQRWDAIFGSSSAPELEAGRLAKFSVFHFLRAGFFDDFPAIGFCTSASLK